MICPNCKSNVEEGAKFCGTCGTPLNQVQQAPLQPVQTTQVPPQQPRQEVQTNVQAPKKKRKKTWLVVLIIIVALLAVGVVVWFLGDSELTSGSDRPGREESGDRNDSDDSEDSDDGEDILKHTIMVYIVGSDLESQGGAATRDINEMLNAEFGEDTCIVLQTGGCSKWQNTTMKNGEVQRFLIQSDGIREIEALGTTPMLTVDALADFITFSAQSYPAEKYTLVLWDHGGGAPIGFGVDEMYPNDFLFDYEIGEALDKAGIDFECVVFDACNMCTLEVAMAIKDHAKYMIAAESYLLGVGMDYTSWLNYYSEEDGTVLEGYEILATTYMDSVESFDKPASISLISLSKIDAVYEAYIEYIGSIHSDILNGGYASVLKARGECGLYDGTDSVDIITLATQYPAKGSADLMNAVVNAVYYTESDFAYGHGLAAYFPCTEVPVYDYARNNMEELDYEMSLLECFDDYVSINLTYLGSEYVENYAGDWYDAAVANSYVDDGYEAGEYLVEMVLKDGYYAVPIAEGAWDIISSVSVGLAVMQDDENAMFFGMENAFTFSVDEDGDIIVEPPSHWTLVNGNIVSYFGLDYYVDSSSGKWSQTGLIFARCNGEDIAMVTYYDQDYPQGAIVGYVPYNFTTNESGNFTEFNENDVIQLVMPCINGVTGQDTYVDYGNSFYASELELSYEEVSYEGATVIIWYEIVDIYGNVYTTNEIVF